MGWRDGETLVDQTKSKIKTGDAMDVDPLSGAGATHIGVLSEDRHGLIDHHATLML